MSNHPGTVKFCSHCGSTDVVKDAFAEWCTDTQQWTLAIISDENDYCLSCETSTVIRERSLVAQDSNISRSP